MTSRFSTPSAAGAGRSFTADVLPGQVETGDMADPQNAVVRAGREGRAVVRERQAAEVGGVVLVERRPPRGPGPRVPETNAAGTAAHQEAAVGRERDTGEAPVVPLKPHALRTVARVPEA